MTKRIVSGIFILAALGALGIILAGALTSGEQLIVRFLTAVIVAALGLYVISDLRLQTGQADQPMESRSRADAEPGAPPNSTAAYMATVTNGYGTDPAGPGQGDEPSKRHEAAPPRPARPSMPSGAGSSGDHGRSPFAPAAQPTQRFDGTARAVRSGPPPMPPAGPAPMEPVTKAKGGLAALDPEHATATAPIPITRWTSGDDHGDDGDRLAPVEAEDTPPGGSGNGTGAGTASAESVTTEAGSSGTGSAPDSASSSDSVGNGGNDGPTYSHVGSFTYSGRLDTATTWWPAPETGDGPATADTTTELDDPNDRELETTEGTTGDSYDPSSAAVTDEVTDIGRRLRAVPDYRPDDGSDGDPYSTGNIHDAVSGHDADDNLTLDGEISGDGATVDDAVIADTPPIGLDETPAESVTELHHFAPVDTGLREPEPRDLTPGHEQDHDPATEAAATATPGNDIAVLDAAIDHLEAAGYADTPRTPMIDLRNRSVIEPDGVAKAIQAGEHQVVETLIRQGMLSTSGPITDRDVRTMVYVAFTSNELRKLILAGGRPDTERADLELGPVELFDERRFAPTPCTLYTRRRHPTLEPSRTGIEPPGDASDIGSEPATVGDPAGTGMPAPRHVYRVDADASPETVA